MTHVTHHECVLPEIDTSGLPKLAPNAKCIEKFFRSLRKLFLLDPNHFQCKELFRNQSAILAEKKSHATGPFYFVIHPMSRLSSILQALFFIVWYYGLIIDPVVSYMSHDVYRSMTNVQFYVTSPIRLILILIFFNMGYIDMKTREVTLESKKIIRKYLSTYFLFDFIATQYPLYWPSVHLLTHYSKTYRPFLAFFMISHILCILCSSVRIPALLSMLNHVLTYLNVIKPLRKVCCYIIKTFLIIHLLCFVMFYIPRLVFVYYDRTPRESWSFKVNFVGDEAFFIRYGQLFFMVCCYFFGVEHDLHVTILIEQIVAIFITFFGRLYTLYFLADMLRTFGIIGVSESMYERQMSVIQQYMIDQDLQDNLRHSMFDYYEYKYQGCFFEEERIINNLSDNLRIELFLFAARKMFRKADIFRKIPNKDLGIIIALMKTITYAPGDVIIRTGSRKKKIYFISSGTVAVMSIDGLELCHLEDGDEFGSSCLFSKRQLYDIVAVEMTEVFIIDKQQFTTFLASYPELNLEFYKSVKEAHRRLKTLEEDCSAKIDLFSQAAKGHIFEKPTKRVKVND